MAYSYFAALALGVLGEPGVRLRWLALGFLLVVLGLIAMIIVDRRRLRRQRAEQAAAPRPKEGAM